MKQIISCGAIAALALVAAPASSAELIRDYRFQGNLSDALGHGALSAFSSGRGRFETRTVAGVQRSVFTWDAPGGLIMVGNVQELAGGFSIAVLFEFDEVNDWRKVIDFRNREMDGGVYVLGGDLSFYPVGENHGRAGWVRPDRFVQLVYTWDPSAEPGPLASIYGDGRLEHAAVDHGHEGAMLGAHNSIVFFRDDVSTEDEHSGGSVARLRVYRGVLTAEEIVDLDTVPGGGALCEADMDGDGVAGVADLLAFLSAFRAGEGDMNGDGEVGVGDLLAFLTAFRAGC